MSTNKRKWFHFRIFFIKIITIDWTHSWVIFFLWTIDFRILLDQISIIVKSNLQS
jgi:hypothetical protein